MGWELDNLKNEVERLKYQLYRFLDKEDFNREKYNIDKQISDKVSNWELDPLNERLDRIEEALDQIKMNLNL